MIKILNRFTENQLKEIAEAIHIYFNLVSSKRIYELILQVNSIDTTLYLLMYHKETAITIDNIVYQYLQGVDNAQHD